PRGAVPGQPCPGPAERGAAHRRPNPPADRRFYEGQLAEHHAGVLPQRRPRARRARLPRQDDPQRGTNRGRGCLSDNAQMTTRREFLVLAAASLAAPTAAKAQLDPNLAAKRKAAYEEALGKVVGGARVRAGRVKLQLPPLIDNGNSVPLSVCLEEGLI